MLNKKIRSIKMKFLIKLFIIIFMCFLSYRGAISIGLINEKHLNNIKNNISIDNDIKYIYFYIKNKI